MNDENNKDVQSAEADSKVEEAVEEAQESANKSEDAAAEAVEAAQEAKEAVEEVKGVVGEVKEEVKKEVKTEEPKKPAKEAAPAGGQVSKKLEDIIAIIEKLTVLELADLVKALEERFGVTATAPVAVASGAAPAAAGGEADEAVDEGQTSFNVILADGGANKISVIKAVREIVPTLGLKEAKDLVDGAPKPVLEGAGKDAANEAKAKLEAAGGKVELK